jgi:hypothetical protein
MKSVELGKIATNRANGGRTISPQFTQTKRGLYQMTLTTHKRCLLSSTLILLLLSFFSMVSAHEQSSDNYTMPKDVLSNGGDKSNSSNYRMMATVGQYTTRRVQSHRVLQAGFHQRRIRKPCSDGSQDCIKCTVKLQDLNPPTRPSLKTQLKIYVAGTEYTIETDGQQNADGSTNCLLPPELSVGNYSLCVKTRHSLANRIEPITNPVHFGELLEGNTTENDGKHVINHFDASAIGSCYRKEDDCIGIDKTDLNEDAKIDVNDILLLQTNIDTPKGSEIPPICEFDTGTPPTLRRGGRNNGAITLRTTVIPENLAIGTSFNVTVWVDNHKHQAVDTVAAYLNFDPAKLQVNQITTGNTFDIALQNQFDNQIGKINFLALAWDNPVPTDSFTLFTANMTLLAQSGEKTLSFNTHSKNRKTGAAFSGESVSSRQIGEVMFEDMSTIAPASCQLYAVHDKKRNDSQLFTVTLETGEVNELGPLYEGYDIEALAIHPETNQIYAASGNNVAKGHPKGHLYLVDSNTGSVLNIGSTGFQEIGDLAFGPDGTLWAWAKGDGLITLDPITGIGTLQIPSDLLVEGLTLNKNQGTQFFGAIQTDLWHYDMEADTLDIACTNLLGETEALEMISGGLLLFGTHQDKTFSLHALDAKTCEIIIAEEIPTNQFNDVEGIALPVEACNQ